MSAPPLPELKKCPTGIAGFDEVSGGGLPCGRPTLIAGHAGAGKTLFALEFVLHGIEQYDEPGVFLSFEESAADLAINVAALGYDLNRHERDGQLQILHIELDGDALIEAGEYDLDGIFLRLGAAIDATKARRVAIDAVENLFSVFTDLRILRAEFRRLMEWLKHKGITAIVTTERGTDSLTRHGLEEYIADCVIALDNRIENQLATRRLRIVKYRGSAHGGDEIPFVLDRHGFSVIPVTSAGLAYPVSKERISSGIDSLDDMFEGGFFRGSSILVSGTSGTGKSSLAAQMIAAACSRGERSLYMALEESPDQIERNMSSIGMDLAYWRTQGMLRFHAARPTSSGLETHLSNMANLIAEFRPRMVIIDPITAFNTGCGYDRVKLMLIRVIDLFKAHGITAVFNSLTSADQAVESNMMEFCSLVDIWLLLRNLESLGERTRGLYVCKARGTSHSNQIREFLLTDKGVKLVDVMLDDEGQILTGSARMLHREMNQRETTARDLDKNRRRALLDNRHQLLDAKIAALRAEYDEELSALDIELEGERAGLQQADRAFSELATRRSHNFRDPK